MSFYTYWGPKFPIFCVTGNSQSSKFYTGSADGIYVWNTLDVEKVDIFSSNQDELPIIVNHFSHHNNEPIWDLKLHPMSPLLISAGADDSICLCNTSDEKSKDNLLFWYIKIDDGVKETPTSIDWLPSSV